MKQYFELIKQSRQNLLILISGFSIEELNKIPENYNNNLIWNLGHVIVTQQILCYKLADVNPRLDIAQYTKYAKGSKPEGDISLDEYELLKSLALTTVSDMEEDYNTGLFISYNSYSTSFGVDLNSIEDAIHFIGIHEGMHYGYSMALKRNINL